MNYSFQSGNSQLKINYHIFKVLVIIQSYSLNYRILVINFSQYSAIKLHSQINAAIHYHIFICL